MPVPLEMQIADPVEIEKMVDKIIADNPKQVEQYRGGKTKLQGFFAGQVWTCRNGRIFMFVPSTYVGIILVRPNAGNEII